VRRRWRILIAIVIALAALLVVNAIVLDQQTKPARVTVSGGRLLDLPGGTIQVTDTGPERKGGAGAPIVLLHCYACSLHWWDGLAPLLARDHRVIRIDLLGFGGSEKPKSGYSMESQASLVALALSRLHVQGAVVVGHSMGFDVASALAAQSSELVDRLVDIDEAPDNGFGNQPFLARLGHLPVVGQGLWRVTPDFAVRHEYGAAFAPGYEASDGFPDSDQTVDDFRAMTYTSYDESAAEEHDYANEQPLDERVRNAAVPLLVIFGTQDQIWDDPEAAAEAYRDVPGARIEMIPGAGHSPNVEKPEETSRLILEFATGAAGPNRKHGER
jgi:pimeloyl-ACP methyl ester carboxylesterase